jgi:aminoglycoside phosphotransferase (APT) family kinase protein
MDEERRASLARFLGERAGRPVHVAAVERITVGHSRAMYRVATDAGRFVVRVEQGGVFGTSGAEEARVMRALGAAGYPVATVRWEEPSGHVLGRPFFVMDHLDVEPGPSGADERAIDRPVAEAFVRNLAQLHALDPERLTGAFDCVPADPSAATHQQIDRWAAVYRSALPVRSPLLEEAAAWLHHHAPPLEQLAVVHGDAGPGNFLHSGGEVVAVTDWEFAHLGDPAEDWSFVVAMRGRRTMPRAEWLDLFSRVAAFTMPEPRWRYWEAFNLFKGACANTTGLAVFESGANRAPNMAIIGTHLHQVFLRRLVDITGEELR